MKRKYMKLMAILLSLAISEINSPKAMAQRWYGNEYYLERDETDKESDKQIDAMLFDYEQVLNKLTYKELCCFNIDLAHGPADVWFPIAIYISADRAISQVNALNYDEYYLPMTNARIKDAYTLIDGRPKKISDINLLDNIDKNNLAFSLVQKDSKGTDQIVGYINGKDMIAMTLGSYKNYDKAKQKTKKY